MINIHDWYCPKCKRCVAHDECIDRQYLTRGIPGDDLTHRDCGEKAIRVVRQLVPLGQCRMDATGGFSTF